MLGFGSTLGVFVGGVSFGFAGFAFALFATSALALVSPPQIVVPAVMLISDTLTLPLLWEHRRHVRRDALREVPPFAPWSLGLLIVGVLLGTVVLGGVSPEIGRLALAVVILAFVGFQVAQPLVAVPPEAPARGAGTGAGAALVGGFLDGWLSTGGVAIAVYLTWKRFAPGVFVAGILVYFLVTDLLRVISYTAFGYWSAETLALYVRVVPIALAGFIGGVVLRRFLVPSWAFRAVVLFLLTAYGLALIGRALLVR